MIRRPEDYTEVRPEVITDYAIRHFDFRITDEKRRAVGCRVTFRTVRYVPATEGRSYYLVPNDLVGPDVIEASFHATRDGWTYGASNGTKKFTSAEAFEKWASKSVADCRKRYAKKYGVK